MKPSSSCQSLCLYVILLFHFLINNNIVRHLVVGRPGFRVADYGHQSVSLLVHGLSFIRVRWPAHFFLIVWWRSLVLRTTLVWQIYEQVGIQWLFSVMEMTRNSRSSYGSGGPTFTEVDPSEHTIWNLCTRNSGFRSGLLLAPMAR